MRAYRSLAVVFVLVLFAICFAGRAHAVDYSQCMSSSTSALCADQSTANAGALYALAQYKSAHSADDYSNYVTCTEVIQPSGEDLGKVIAWLEYTSYGCSQGRVGSYFGPWQRDFPKNLCIDKPPLSGMTAQISSATNLGMVCHDGCIYVDNRSDADRSSYLLGGVPPAFTGVDGWVPNGGTCGTGDDLDPPSPGDGCKPLGDLTECVKPNGDLCATKNGRATSFCWTPNNDGPQRDNNDYGNLKPDPYTPTPPTNPPPDGGTWGPPSCSPVTINGKPHTVCTGNSTGTGNTGGGGTPGTGTSGSGSTSCDPSKQDCSGAGAAGSGVGKLYTRDEITVDTSLQRLQTAAAGSPIVQSFTHFFTGCSASGSCPSATWEASLFGISESLSIFCNGVLDDLVTFAGWVAFLGMVLFALRVAVL